MQKSVDGRSKTKASKKVVFLSGSVSSLSDPIDSVKYCNSDSNHGTHNQPLKTQRPFKEGKRSNEAENIDIFRTSAITPSIKLTSTTQTSKNTSLGPTNPTFNPENSVSRERVRKDQTPDKKRNKQSHYSKSAFVSSATDRGNMDLGSDPVSRLQTAGKSNVYRNRHSVKAKSLTEGRRNNNILNSVQDRLGGQFEPHINKSDGLTNMTPKLGTQFRSSVAFQNVLFDIYGNPNNGNSRCLTKPNTRGRNIVIYDTRFVGKIRAHKKRTRLEVKGKQESCGSSKVNRTITERVQTQKNGWDVIRRFYTEKKTQPIVRRSIQSEHDRRTALNELPSLEHIRRDLYERYGVIPRRGSDGTLVQENCMMGDHIRSMLVGQTKNCAVNKHQVSSLSPQKARCVSSQRQVSSWTKKQ